VGGKWLFFGISAPAGPAAGLNLNAADRDKHVDAALDCGPAASQLFRHLGLAAPAPAIIVRVLA
jgi:hypothetical protein